MDDFLTIDYAEHWYDSGIPRKPRERTNSLETVIVVCISWKNIIPSILLQFGQYVYAKMRRQNIKLISSK